jgi:hypothetical protein
MMKYHALPILEDNLMMTNGTSLFRPPFSNGIADEGY